MTLAPGPPIRAVIDNSVLLPILRRPNPGTHWLVMLWTERTIVPIVNRETLEELRQQLLENSPTTRHYQATLFADARLRIYRPWCELFIPPPNSALPETPACRDPQDQMFIDLAATGSADALVTRDNDLLSMQDQVPFLILDDRAFRSLAPL